MKSEEYIAELGFESHSAMIQKVYAFPIKL